MANVGGKPLGHCIESAVLTSKGELNVDDEEEIDIIGIKNEEEKKQNPVNESKVQEDVENVRSTKESSSQKQERQDKLNIYDTKDVENMISTNSKHRSTRAETSVIGNNGVEDELELEISKVCASDEELINRYVNSTESNVDDDACSSMSSASSSRRSSRRSSVNSSTDTLKNNIDYGKREEFDQERLGYAGLENQLSDDEDDDDDDDDEDAKCSDPYERFFFESDYLALKDNKHYHLLLQTLVALEAQRMQAIKDLDTLCEEEAKALDNPIGFVEKLQNNEPLDLPAPQNVIKLPNVPWELYASSVGPIENFSAHPNTRAAVNQTEKVQQIPSNLSNISVPEKISAPSRGSDTIFSEAVKSNVAGDDLESNKAVTFNQPWTVEEQTRLEKLLQVYPQEEVESKRWEKIAKALGNRTPKQVASRIQKYFIKLARAGLPVPGRVPNLPKAGSRLTKRSSYYNTVGFRNSTFFPSYQPRVYMDDNKDDDDESSVALSDDTSYLSDDDPISEELRQTNEYKVLLELKKMKRRKMQHAEQCDGCGDSPIVGSRWYCQDCPDNRSIDFCSSCVENRLKCDPCKDLAWRAVDHVKCPYVRSTHCTGNPRGMSESCGHSRQHHLVPVSRDSRFFVDGDYVSMSASTPGYNYLDPNFIPAVS